MKLSISTSIIIASVIGATVTAYPAEFIKRGEFTALSFPCGDDVPNVRGYLIQIINMY